MTPTIEQEKELLIAAAKAMGIVGHLVEYGYGANIKLVIEGVTADPDMDYVKTYWNPYRNAEQLNEMRAKKLVDTRWLTYDGESVVRCSSESDCYTTERLTNHPSPQAAEAWCALRVVAEIGRMK